jgi:DNA-binding transcriptional MerR regulator
MARQALQIGEVANQSGVSIDTVRYYERRNLIKRPVRSAGGFRLFAPETIERIKFIKQAQELGFSLDEIGELLTNANGIDECRRVRDLLRVKLDEIDARMKKLGEFRQTLQENLTECEREISKHGQDAHCPVIVNIERGSHAEEITEESYERT